MSHLASYSGGLLPLEQGPPPSADRVAGDGDREIVLDKGLSPCAMFGKRNQIEGVSHFMSPVDDREIISRALDHVKTAHQHLYEALRRMSDDRVKSAIVELDAALIKLRFIGKDS